MGEFAVRALIREELTPPPFPPPPPFSFAFFLLSLVVKQPFSAASPFSSPLLPLLFEIASTKGKEGFLFPPLRLCLGQEFKLLFYLCFLLQQ